MKISKQLTLLLSLTLLCDSIAIAEDRSSSDRKRGNGQGETSGGTSSGSGSSSGSSYGSSGGSNGNGSGNANSGGSNGNGWGHSNGNGNANSGGSNGNSSPKGQPAFKKVTEVNLQDMVNRMTDGKLGRLLISSGSQTLLGGKCDVQVDQYGSTLYTLLIPNSTVKKIGSKATPQLNVNFKQRNIRRIEKIKLPPASIEETLRSSDEIDVALKELGSTFKGEIADRQWPCGSSTAETSNLPFFDLKTEVKFYRDEETNETVCVAPSGKEVLIRKAESCEMEPIPDVLPDDLCKYVEHIVRNEMQDELEMAIYEKPVSPETSGGTVTTGGSAGGSQSGVQPKKTRAQRRAERLARQEARKAGRSGPRYDRLDNEMRRKIRIARYVNMDPEIVTYVNTVKIPLADRFLSKETVDFLEDESDEEVDFDTLPEGSQVELTRLALSVESIRDEEDFIQPSAPLLQMMDSFRNFADAIIRNNPDLEMSLYRFPRKDNLRKNILSRLERLKKESGQEYKTDLQCETQPESTVKIGKRMKRMMSRSRDRKAPETRLQNARQTERFAYTRRVPELVEERQIRRVPTPIPRPRPIPR